MCERSDGSGRKKAIPPLIAAPLCQFKLWRRASSRAECRRHVLESAARRSLALPFTCWEDAWEGERWASVLASRDVEGVCSSPRLDGVSRLARWRWYRDLGQ